ncbi:MAG: caspase family protein [Waterburya sp.]
MIEGLSKRIAFVVSGQTGEELNAGNSDVSRIYSTLTNPNLGQCDNKIAPIHNCSNSQTFWDCFHDLIDNWNSSNQLIFYFSGHGIKRNNQYCLQVGIDNKSKNFILFNSVLDQLSSNYVRRAILIIDACYSGNTTGEKNTQNFIGDIELDKKILRGIAIIASSGKSQPSHELKDKSYSVFTDLLCEGIENGLDGNPTNNGLIGINDIVHYINQKLTKDPKYNNYPPKSKV